MEEEQKATDLHSHNIAPEVSNPMSAPGNNQNNSGKKYLFVAWDFVKIIIIAALIVLPIRYFIFQPFIVKGESMVPNFHSGDYLIIDEISYAFGNPQRGDVVVLKYPLDPSQRFIKRIVGLPGETVQVKDGMITISKDGNTFVLDEKKYLPDLASTDGDVNLTLGEDKYFVLGDNRQFSYDSRRWGALPEKDIIGKALFRVFPIKQISLFVAPAY
ncbi:MAG: signal peptidase I [bacterium]|nr:signal peptidase I [bacterium]